MRNFSRRLQKLEATSRPQAVACRWYCLDYRMKFGPPDPPDKETGLQIQVCRLDSPIWKRVKGTERPETLREYEQFKTEYREERARAHQEAKRNTWRAGKQMIQDKD